MKLRLVGLALLAIAALLALGAVPALGAPAANPLFVLRPERDPKSPVQTPPPAGEFDGPCGLAVDTQANLYISDYYHHVIDVYSPGGGYSTQLAKVDPTDGPCGLALGPAGNLYVNNFHRNVVRYGTLSSFGSPTIIAGAGIDSSHPTGVAVEEAGTVYVDERDRIASFDAAGIEGQAVGEGSLIDGYGVAVSGYPATAGYLYVPDAATNTVRVYDPATSTTDPVAEIDGSATPQGSFLSLRDSAVALDNARGTLYVLDDLSPPYTEGHEGVVYAFDASGAYLGRLKFSVQSALPAGLAVDNSALATQGRVYLTDGYAELGGVYAYGPEAAGTGGVALPQGASPAAPAAAPEPAIAAVTSGPAVAPASVAAPAGSAPSSEAAAPVPGAHRAKAKAKKHHHRRHHHRAAERRKR